MTPVQKQEAIEVLKEKFSQYSNFYITNTESLTVDQVSKLRRLCFEKNVEMKVAKNTLIKKALESLNSEKIIKNAIKKAEDKVKEYERTHVS